MNKFTLALILLAVLTLPALAWPGSGAARGRGMAAGIGLARGQGTATGTGAVIYRNDTGRLRWQTGTGQVSGRGVAVGRGQVAGRATAVGRGRVAGRGQIRPR